MADASDRRFFLRHVLAKSVDGATEVAKGWNEVKRTAIGTVVGRDLDELAKPSGELQAGKAPVLDAGSAKRLARPAELKRLAVDIGLEEFADSIAAAARVSIRLIPDTDEVLYRPGSTRLGGAPDLPAGMRWPDREGKPMTFLGQVNLAETRRLGLADDLPATGLLSVFRDFSAPFDGTMAADAGAVRVLQLRGEPASFTARDAHGDPAERGGLPIRQSAELVLPDGVSAEIPGLDFGPDERVVWDSLRMQLAELQGTTLESREAEFRSLHRFAGHPDARRGGMQLTAAICSAGHDVGQVSARRHAEAEALADDAAKWRLLFQLSIDPRFGWNWSPGTMRLFVWIHEDNLSESDFDQVWAITQ